MLAPFESSRRSLYHPLPAPFRFTCHSTFSNAISSPPLFHVPAFCSVLLRPNASKEQTASLASVASMSGCPCVCTVKLMALLPHTMLYDSASVSTFVLP